MSDVPQAQTGSPFKAYPSDRVIGTIDSPDDLQAALATLQDADIEVERVFSGQAGIERIDRSGKYHGPLARLVRFVQFMGEEQTHLQQHEAQLAAGHFLVSVVVGKDTALKDKVRDILHAHGGHYVHYYGSSTIQDL